MTWGLTTFETGRSLAMVSRSTLALVHTDNPRAMNLLWRMVANDAPFDEIVEELAREGVNGLPDFGLARLEPEGVRVVARGSVAIVVDLAVDGPRRIDASHLRTWSEAFVADAIGLAIDDVSELGPDEPHALCVLAGVVPARSLRRDLRVADPRADSVERTWGPPAVVRGTPTSEQTLVSIPIHDVPIHDVPIHDVATDEPVPAGDASGPPAARSGDDADPSSARGSPEPGSLIDEVPFESGASATADPGDHNGLTVSRAHLRAFATDEGAPAAPTPSGPFVSAINCPVGHPNPPGASRCRTCGATPTRSNPIQIPRPVLGVLVFSTGERVPIDRPMIIGRRPKVIGTAEWELPKLVTIESDGRGLSRAHLEVRLDGWRVMVKDLNSANGTEISVPGQPPREVEPGEEVQIVDGTRVDLGHEVHFIVEGLA